MKQAVRALRLNSRLLPLFLKYLRAKGGDPVPIVARFCLPADVEGQNEVDAPMSTVQDLPGEEVAFLLGYAEMRAFVRAFVRWTGLTPARYRQQRGVPAAQGKAS